MKKTLCLLFFAPLMMSAADIYMIGDSTMQGYHQNRYPLTGWGAKLQDFCKKRVRVHNFGRSGSSSKSYYNGKYWKIVLKNIKPGDFVIIQFGHNDSLRKEEKYTDPDSTFQEYLKKYISEAREKKAIPVLMTQTMICRFKDGKVSNNAVEQRYIDASRKVAGEMNVELIDHNKWASEKLAAFGQEKAQTFYMYLKKGEYPAYPDGRSDNCHLHERGAVFYAGGAAEIAKKENLKIAKLFK